MAQQHLDPTDPTAGPVGSGDRRRPRGLPAGPGHGVPPRPAAAPRDRRRGSATARRSPSTRRAPCAARPAASAAPCTPSARSWTPTGPRRLRPELAWLSGTLAHGARVRGPAGAAAAGAAPAVGRDGVPRAAGGRGTASRPTGGPAARRARPRPRPRPTGGNLTVGAAKAGALLERQLTLARTRAHSAALQALGSSRFHAVADNVAVLASEVPLTPGGRRRRPAPLAAAAEERLDRRRGRAPPGHRGPPVQRGGPDPRPLPGPVPAPPGRPLAPGPPAAAPAPLRPRGPARRRRPRSTSAC